MRSRRVRAAAFFAVALIAAALGAALVAGYGSSVARGYGPLRPVVVTAAGLRPRRVIGPQEVAAALEVRKVPARFVPVGALAAPGDALGLAPRQPVPAGIYLLASQLRAPGQARPALPGLIGDRRPVEITVSGAAAVLATGRPSTGSRVDVVVTSEPTGPGPGRTYIAAAGVPLLGLGPGPDGPGPGGNLGGDAGADPTPGASPDRGGKLCQEADSDPGALAMQARQRDIEELAALLRKQLVERRRASAAGGAGGGLGFAEEVERLLDEQAALLGREDRRAIAARIARDTVGLGPLEDLLADPTVEEVMVDGPASVYVERRGRIEPTAVAFADEEELRNAVERILAPLGRRIDELSPMVDARLADGSRVNVVIPPLAIDGPAVSIRRFGARRPGPDELVEMGTLSGEHHRRLEQAVRSRRSILISGGTGSGKTTLLNAVSSFIAAGERVVTIEDAAELRLQQPHVVRLESRPASVEGSGEVTIRDLLRNALRMRPDRIVIGEVRGAEALDLLTALNTGHDGALSTVHANSPADAIARLETLALMAGVGLPHAAIAEQARRGIELVVQIERRADGERRVVEIAEPGG